MHYTNITAITGTSQHKMSNGILLAPPSGRASARSRHRVASSAIAARALARAPGPEGALGTG